MNNLSHDGSEVTRRGSIIIGKVMAIDQQYYGCIEFRHKL